MLVSLCIIGVRISKAMTYGITLSSKKIVSSKRSAVHVKMANAKGIVSKSGAREETSPSLLNPLRLFTKEPQLSPIMHERPNVNPIIAAEANGSAWYANDSMGMIPIRK